MYHLSRTTSFIVREMTPKDIPMYTKNPREAKNLSRGEVFTSMIHFFGVHVTTIPIVVGEAKRHSKKGACDNNSC